MMMAIINLAFEEIKDHKEQYKNKFELVDYVKRTAKEMIGIEVAEPIVPIYLDKAAIRRLKMQEEQTDPETAEVAEEFTTKTDALFEYVREQYLTEDFVDSAEGKQLIDKMNESISNLGDAISDAKKKKEIGFDALFTGDNQ